MIKMAQLENIRKMYFMEDLSIREISRRTGIHRDTISKYISLDEPKPPKYKLTTEHRHPVLGPYIPMIQQIMEGDKNRHRKQRHTGAKIFEILKGEGFPGGYNTISDYLRKEYRKHKEAFLPLEFELGAYAEVDWTEAYFFLKGKETKAHIFVMKLRGSGGFYVKAYPFEKQEAFFDGHIKCFEFMNGVPYKMAYDNLKTAVKKVLQGSNREEQEQFIALRTHYLYDSTFCMPAKGNQKGGVENAGKEAVRRFFVPYPDVDSFDELNQYLHNECTRMLEKNQKWEAEKAALRPLPAVRFDGARYKEAKVNRYSMIQFETNRYSVPTSYVGEKVTVKASAEEINIISKGTTIAEHPRVYGRNQDHITLDHYLELLLQKSRALVNTKVYRHQTLPPVYEQYRRCLSARNPRGNREFVKILMLHRDYPTAQVAEAIEIAMAFNVYGYDGVLNILGQSLVPSHKVIPLSKEKLQSIPEVIVAPPDLDKYKALMTGGGL
jgi:Transposase and inactivated derivatives